MSERSRCVKNPFKTERKMLGMILQENETYFINFAADKRSSPELNYKGYGVYTGRQTKDEEGNLLFWFDHLTEEKGFADGGWFSAENITSLYNKALASAS